MPDSAPDTRLDPQVKESNGWHGDIKEGLANSPQQPTQGHLHSSKANLGCTMLIATCFACIAFKSCSLLHYALKEGIHTSMSTYWLTGRRMYACNVCPSSWRLVTGTTILTGRVAAYTMGSIFAMIARINRRSVPQPVSGHGLCYVQLVSPI